MLICFLLLWFDEHAEVEDADKDEEDPTTDHDAEKLEGLNVSNLK